MKFKIQLKIQREKNFRYVEKLARQLFNGDNNQAAFRILSDFRKGKFGWMALERPMK